MVYKHFSWVFRSSFIFLAVRAYKLCLLLVDITFTSTWFCWSILQLIYTYFLIDIDQVGCSQSFPSRASFSTYFRKYLLEDFSPYSLRKKPVEFTFKYVSTICYLDWILSLFGYFNLSSLFAYSFSGAADSKS